jgi:hypothetical protein
MGSQQITFVEEIHHMASLGSLKVLCVPTNIKRRHLVLKKLVLQVVKNTPNILFILMVDAICIGAQQKSYKNKS